jgi:hypothetical protein
MAGLPALALATESSSNKSIAFSQVAALTLRLKVYILGFATFRPRKNMIDVKFDSAIIQRTRATRLTCKAVSEKYPKTHSVRYIPTGPSLER